LLTPHYSRKLCDSNCLWKEPYVAWSESVNA
jgi:hypothetical protein